MSFWDAIGTTDLLRFLTQRCSVLAVFPRKAHAIVTLLLISMAIGAMMACHVHTTPLDHGGHEHERSGKSHHRSSAHSLLDFACRGMTAVLPPMVTIAVLLFEGFHAPPLWVKLPLIVSPFFIPPRYLIP
jgi:hypothetical protein